MIEETLLQILCCPETHQPLRQADSNTVRALNEKVGAGQLKNRAGKPVTIPFEEALIREDGKYLYVVRGNIPVMLIDEAIPL